jgi:hypothetical protein
VFYRIRHSAFWGSLPGILFRFAVFFPALAVVLVFPSCEKLRNAAYSALERAAEPAVDPPAEELPDLGEAIMALTGVEQAETGILIGALMLCRRIWWN